ncbi:MAG: hypothetical protein ACE15B_17280 [Bryobacteraceae bacterium]
MERVLNQLTQKLQAAFKDRLVSVLLYGSGAAGDHHARYSDLNILCVLDRVGVAELKSAEPVFRWWREKGNPAPLLLSEQEVRTMTDCFAIEFHDIQARHRVLWGAEVVAPLTVDDSFYRAQVEHELRAKLLRLRQKAGGMMEDAALLRRLIADSVSTFCVLFRHALVLHGVDAGFSKREIVDRARQTFGMDPAPFEKLLDLREQRIKPREVEPVRLLESYMASIQAVIDAVDGLQK